MNSSGCLACINSCYSEVFYDCIFSDCIVTESEVLHKLYYFIQCCVVYSDLRLSYIIVFVVVYFSFYIKSETV